MLNQILYVEDDETSQMLCRRIIQKNAFAKNVHPLLNGREALNYYNWLKGSLPKDNFLYPSLIFLDLNMPVMGGWEFLDEFEKQFSSVFRDTKIVILSSSLEPDEKEKARTYSRVIDFISKPLTVDKLEDLKIKLDMAFGRF